MSTTNQGMSLDLPLDTTPKRDGATDATRARALTVSAGFVTMEAHYRQEDEHRSKSIGTAWAR